MDDKVCTICNGILKWYETGHGDAFYLHWGSYWVLKDHRPDPAPAFEPKS